MRRFAPLLGGLALAGLLAAGVFLQTRHTVTVRADGRTHTWLTHAASAAEILQEAGLSLAAGDTVWAGEAQRQTPVTDLTAVSSAAVFLIRRAPLTRLDVDGQTRLWPAASVPAEVLRAAGVVLRAGDEVWADGARVEPETRLAAPPLYLQVRRAVSVALTAGGAPFTVQTAALTVGEVLWQAGVQLTPADAVAPPAGTPVVAGLALTVTFAQPLTIQADGRAFTTRSRAAQVGAALAEAGLPLAGADYSAPAADQPLPADGLIKIVRVREAVLSEQTVIPRPTVYQALPEVALDTGQTLQAGADGLRRRNVRVRYEDEVEVGRVAEAEVEAQAAAPRVIGYGTQITPQVVDTPDGALEYWRAYTVYATSYSPARAGTPRTARNYGITASGRPLTKGLVAVDRRYIPFGTRMYIPGYGLALAADTGGGVKGRFIDLGYDDDNYQHWGQVVTVYFLTPVPPASQIVWIIPSTVP